MKKKKQNVLWGLVKECCHKKSMICIREEDIPAVEFPNGLPDGYKDIKDYIQNVRDREVNGCKECHYFKNKFKGSKKVEINWNILLMNQIGLAC